MPGTQYVCPMDPEIRQSAPGACPKCGMALEPDVPIAAATRVEYTCPMHPEIVRDAPGACPICGMALEPRTVTLDEAPNPELVDMTRRMWTAALLGLPVFVLAMGDMVLGMGLGGRVDVQVANWVGLVFATPVVFWARLAVLRARLGVDREPPRQHVHADRARRRRGVPVQRGRDDRARICFPTASACTAWSRPTSTRPS